MKPTIKDLAKHLNKSPQSLYQMRKAQPKQYALIWSGWLKYCLDNNNLRCGAKINQ